MSADIGELLARIAPPPFPWTECASCRSTPAHRRQPEPTGAEASRGACFAPHVHHSSHPPPSTHHHPTAVTPLAAHPPCTHDLPACIAPPPPPSAATHPFHTVLAPADGAEAAAYNRQLAPQGLAVARLWRVQNPALWARHALAAAMMAAQQARASDQGRIQGQSQGLEPQSMDTCDDGEAVDGPGTIPTTSVTLAATSPDSALTHATAHSSQPQAATNLHDCAAATEPLLSAAATSLPSPCHGSARLFVAPTQDSEDVRTAMLFHSTSGSVAAVCGEGLDLRLARAGLFGRGLYFSDSAAKAATYGAGSGVLLACRVLLGRVYEYEAGTHEQGLVREPRGFDSVCGAVRDAREYVVYAPERVYVAYVLQVQALPVTVVTGHPALSATSVAVTPLTLPPMSAHMLAQRVLADQLRRALAIRHPFTASPAAAVRAAHTMVDAVDLYRLAIIPRRAFVARVTAAIEPGMQRGVTWTLFLRNNLHTVVDVIDAARTAPACRTVAVTALIDAGRVLLGMLAILPHPAPMSHSQPQLPLPSAGLSTTLVAASLLQPHEHADVEQPCPAVEALGLVGSILAPVASDSGVTHPSPTTTQGTPARPAQRRAATAAPHIMTTVRAATATGTGAAPRSPGSRKRVCDVMEETCVLPA